MKPSSNPKNSFLSRESKPVPQAAPRGAGTKSAAFSGSASQARSGISSARTNAPKPASSHSAGQQTTAVAAAANGQQKASRKTHPSAVPSSASMDAIKTDRGTTIALYALFGAILAGMIYFMALLFLL